MVFRSMADLSISEARDTLAEIINRVVYGGERIILRRHGKKVAALVSARDLERLAKLENRQHPPSRPSRLSRPVRRRGRRRTGV
jgi:prevent-host-death family protein